MPRARAKKKYTVQLWLSRPDGPTIVEWEGWTTDGRAAFEETVEQVQAREEEILSIVVNQVTV